MLKYRFGIPPNIEANGYAWGKITACIDYELTQARGKLKKVVSAFLTHPYRGGLTKTNQLKKDVGIRDAQSQQTIYQLTRSMVGEESYKIIPGTCARVALMVSHCSLQFQHHLTAHSVRRTCNTPVMTFGTSWTNSLI